MIGHNRADGTTGGKKEISNIDLVLISILGHCLPVLIGQLKIGSGVILFYVLNGRIHQFEGNVIGSINRQGPLGFEYPVEHIDDDGRKDQQENPEKLVFGKESYQIPAKIPLAARWKKLQPLKVLK